jgi:hypothetical protein
MLLACVSSKDKNDRPSPFRSDQTTFEGAKLGIEYSSPGVKERKIWDGLVPYGKIWRTGANEATVFQTNQDLLIAGDTLKAGKYAVFTIPGASNWKVIFNSEWDQWGAFNYDASKDALVLTVYPAYSSDFSERMKLHFKDRQLRFHWEFLTFQLPIEVL